MDLLEWAKREIELACKNERRNSENDDWDYGVACYESALKAFESLCEDGHSGMSISITKSILNRLIDCKPLLPIEDTDDIWNKSYDNEDGTKVYQCKRMSSLFKDIHPDGSITYSDINRVKCIDGEGGCWNNGFINSLINKQFPITMPYMPKSNPYTVKVLEFLYDPKNGDFDTLHVVDVVTPSGEKIDINRYFKEGKDSWDEIDLMEFIRRKNYADNSIDKAIDSSKSESSLPYTRVDESLNEKIGIIMNDYKNLLNKAKEFGLDIKLHTNSENSLELYYNDDYPDTILVDKSTSK